MPAATIGEDIASRNASPNSGLLSNSSRISLSVFRINDLTSRASHSAFIDANIEHNKLSKVYLDKCTAL